MSSEAFDHRWLTPHGRAQMLHMGQWFSYSLNVSSCGANETVLVADGSSFRDIESAQAFAAGFFPTACSAAKAAQVIATTASTHPLLHPLANDRTYTGCTGPTETEIELSFGGDVAALTSASRAQIDRVGELIGCCSRVVCAEHGLGARNCSLAELPTAFSGQYWRYYKGPFAVAAYYADAFMLQALSGLHPFAWGEVALDELPQLNQLHQRMMWLGSTLPSAQAFASHALAYLVLTLERARLRAGGPCSSSSVALPGSASALDASALDMSLLDGPSRPRILAVFAHDFNLLYLRRLLRVHWVTDSFDMDTATTASSLSLELHGPDLLPRDQLSPGRCEAEGGEGAGDKGADGKAEGRAANTSAWRLIGKLTASSIEQQRAARPLVPPHAPPGVATVLDMAFDDFKALALPAISPRCVREPLRSAILAMQQEMGAQSQPPPPDAASPPAASLLLSAPTTVAIGIGLLLLGCACGVSVCMLPRLFGRWRTAIPKKRILEMTTSNSA